MNKQAAICRHLLPSINRDDEATVIAVTVAPTVVPCCHIWSHVMAHIQHCNRVRVLLRKVVGTHSRASHGRWPKLWHNALAAASTHSSEHDAREGQSRHSQKDRPGEAHIFASEDVGNELRNAIPRYPNKMKSPSLPTPRYPQQ